VACRSASPGSARTQRAASFRRTASRGTSTFRFEGSELRGDNVVATLLLESSPQTRPLFPHDFKARLRVQLGRELSLQLEVENTGADAFDYELALHTYLGVSDVRSVELEGLAGASYDDKVTGERACRQPAGPLRFVGETDRVTTAARASACSIARASAG